MESKKNLVSSNKRKPSSENSDDAHTVSAKGTRRLRNKTYAKINDEIRKKIIFEVTVLGNKLKTICEKLNINVSSAKNVLAIYKKEGRIEKKKYRVKRRKTGEDHEATPETINSASTKTISNIQPTNANSFSATSLNAPNSGINYQSDKMDFLRSEINLNDLNLDFLFQNFCTCPQLPQLSNPYMYMPDDFNQIVSNYSKYFPMNLM